MLIRKAPDIRSSEITDEQLYWNRRAFIKTASGGALGAMVAAVAIRPSVAQAQVSLGNIKPSPFSTTEPPNLYEHITSYNNSTSLDSTRTIPRGMPGA